MPIRPRLGPAATEEFLLSLKLPIGPRLKETNFRGDKIVLSTIAYSTKISVSDVEGYGFFALELSSLLEAVARNTTLPFIAGRWSRATMDDSLARAEAAMKVVEEILGFHSAVTALRAVLDELKADWNTVVPAGRQLAVVQKDLLVRPLLSFFRSRFPSHGRKRAPFLRGCLLLVGLEKPRSVALEPPRIRDMLRRYDEHRIRNEKGRR